MATAGIKNGDISKGKMFDSKVLPASDQDLHCLLTGISIRNRVKMKMYTRNP